MLHKVALLFLGFAIGTANACEEHVSIVLDNFHKAASEAHGGKYFDLLTEEAVFIGTDASERWSKKEFEAFAKPYFDQGKGWTYTSTSRHIYLSQDQQTAWFDEMLDNENYGVCRGTGVLVKTEGGWKIAQYHLVIPVPNELAKNLVEQIRQPSGQTPDKE
ncbi:nuclear transport factor 2 family protein [Porticoccaceae bacterium LTM1]|nr:nuclear transport factor 2 family protein [Porticoccaceae bacterium LTM1]